MSEVVERRTLEHLVEMHDQTIKRAEEGLQALGSAVQTIRGTCGMYSSVLPHRQGHSLELDMDEEKRLQGLIEEARIRVRESYWQYTLEHSRIKEVMGKKDRERMDKMFQDHSLPEFTVENLFATLQGLYESRDEIIASAVREAYEWLRPRSAQDSYKTNQKEVWALSKKVIKDYGVDTFMGRARLALSTCESLQEVEKAFSALDGKGYPEHSILQQANNAEMERRTEITTPYLHIKWHKSGTVHISFRRPDLVKLFNEVAARGSSALPSKKAA